MGWEWADGIEVHRRRLVACCCAPGGVSSIRVSANGRDVEIGRERWRGTIDVVDVRPLWLEHEVARECKVIDYGVDEWS